MTKEEYKENVIRMWDSLREDEYKGNEYCEGVVCHDCPLYKKACGSLYAYEALEIIENCAKENPIVTNADKFREVFGVESLPIYSCVKPTNECGECEHWHNDRCEANKRFWNAEYKGKTEGCEEE